MAERQQLRDAEVLALLEHAERLDERAGELRAQPDADLWSERSEARKRARRTSDDATSSRPSWGSDHP